MDDEADVCWRLPEPGSIPRSGSVCRDFFDNVAHVVDVTGDGRVVLQPRHGERFSRPLPVFRRHFLVLAEG